MINYSLADTKEFDKNINVEFKELSKSEIKRIIQTGNRDQVYNILPLLTEEELMMASDYDKRVHTRREVDKELAWIENKNNTIKHIRTANKYKDKTATEISNKGLMPLGRRAVSNYQKMAKTLWQRTYGIGSMNRSNQKIWKIRRLDYLECNFLQLSVTGDYSSKALKEQAVIAKASRCKRVDVSPFDNKQLKYRAKLLQEFKTVKKMVSVTTGLISPDGGNPLTVRFGYKGA